MISYAIGLRIVLLTNHNTFHQSSSFLYSYFTNFIVGGVILLGRESYFTSLFPWLGIDYNQPDLGEMHGFTNTTTATTAEFYPCSLTD
jgi:hypothetical protein